jgi:hypothetical protein
LGKKGCLQFRFHNGANVGFKLTGHFRSEAEPHKFELSYKLTSNLLYLVNRFMLNGIIVVKHQKLAKAEKGLPKDRNVIMPKQNISHNPIYLICVLTS